MSWLEDTLKRVEAEAAENCIAVLERKLADIREGRVVVMPVSVQHAEAMHVVAEAYLKANRDRKSGS